MGRSGTHGAARTRTPPMVRRTPTRRRANRRASARRRAGSGEGHAHGPDAQVPSVGPPLTARESDPKRHDMPRRPVYRDNTRPTRFERMLEARFPEYRYGDVLVLLF